MRRLLDQLWIKTGGHSQRHGKRRPITVDDIKAKQQRDVQPRILHRDVLVMVGCRSVHYIDQRTQFAFLDHHVVILAVGSRAGRDACGELVQLSGLLGQRHLAQQCFDLPVQILARQLRIGMSDRRSR